MKEHLTAMVAIIALLAAATALTAPAASGEVVTYNIVGHVSDAEDYTGLEGVQVLISTSSFIQWSDVTDSNGRFSVNVTENTGLKILIGKEGYSIRSGPSCINKVSGSNYYSLDLSIAHFDKETKTYDLTYGSDSLHHILMAKSVGMLNGTVTCDGSPVVNANVVIKSTELSYSTTTNSDGKYSISCSGTYSMTISHTGLVDSVVKDIVVTSDGVTTKNVTMETKDWNIYFGMDMPHLLMIMGAAAGIAGLLIVVLLFLQIKNGNTKITLVDDDLNDEEEKK
jgi:hypothetical protein